jgi:hypothetical protein
MLAALVLGGCQSGRAVIEQLDAGTGVTFAVERAPVTFARTETRYSRSARDYVYLGPVEINLRGTREYFLWVGFASTIDRGYLAPESEEPVRLRLRIQGAPVELELASWAERVPGLSGVKLYEPSVGPRLALAARVTLDQLRILSGEGLPSIVVETADGRSREFALWQERQDWSRFLARATGP